MMLVIIELAIFNNFGTLWIFSYNAGNIYVYLSRIYTYIFYFEETAVAPHFWVSWRLFVSSPLQPHVSELPHPS